MKRWMVIAVLLLAACEQEVTGPQATAAGGEKPVVYTVNYPFACALAADVQGQVDCACEGFEPGKDLRL